jgi:hypothetical protein
MSKKETESKQEVMSDLNKEFTNDLERVLPIIRKVAIVLIIGATIYAAIYIYQHSVITKNGTEWMQLKAAGTDTVLLEQVCADANQQVVKDEALKRIAAQLLSTGRTTEAIEKFDEILKTSTDVATKELALFGKANAFSNSTETYDKAISIYREIAQGDSSRKAEALYLAGIILDRQTKVADANACYQAIIALGEGEYKQRAEQALAQ